MVQNALLEVTTKCNLGCPGCYMGKRLNSGEEFEKSLFLNILDAANPKKVDFLGGEPLLWPFLDEAIKTCSEKGIKCEVYSNLTLLTKKRAKYFLDKGVSVTGKLNVGTLDSKNQLKIQARLIGSDMGNVSRMIAGISTLKKVGYSAPLFKLDNFIRKENVPFVKDFLIFCLKNNIEPLLELSCNKIDLNQAEISSVVQQVKDACNIDKVILPHFTHSCPYYHCALYFRPNGDIQACSGNPTPLANFFNDQNPVKKALSHPIILARKAVSKNIERKCIGCRARAELLASSASPDPICKFL